MKQDSLARGCLRAFITGGVLSAVGQLVLLALRAAGLPEGEAISGMMILLGAAGALATRSGAYQRLETFGGMGAMLPVSGLAAGISEAVGARRETRGRGWRAALGGAGAVARNFAPGFVLALVLAVLLRTG